MTACFSAVLTHFIQQSTYFHSESFLIFLFWYKHIQLKYYDKFNNQLQNEYTIPNIDEFQKNY